MGLVSIKALDRAKEFYMTHLYCGRCGKWQDISSVKWNIRGQPKCPYCGNILRFKPRKRKNLDSKQVRMKLKLIDLFRRLSNERTKNKSTSF